METRFKTGKLEITINTSQFKDQLKPGDHVEVEGLKDLFLVTEKHESKYGRFTARPVLLEQMQSVSVRKIYPNQEIECSYSNEQEKRTAPISLLAVHYMQEQLKFNQKPGTFTG